MQRLRPGIKSHYSIHSSISDQFCDFNEERKIQLDNCYPFSNFNGSNPPDWHMSSINKRDGFLNKQSWNSANYFEEDDE